MNITAAGVKKEKADGLTVAQLIEQENVETPQYVTVTINDEFVESGAFATTTSKTATALNFCTSWEADSNGIHERTA